MSSCLYEKEPIMLILDGEHSSIAEIKCALTALLPEGASGLDGTRADIFTYNSKTMVLLYPIPPKRERGRYMRL